MLRGIRRPKLVDAGVIPKARSADLAEARLRDLIAAHGPTLVAVDAPLTLPPCLTCPSSCAGPGADRCELRAARLVWEAGGNPVTERLCEVRLREEMGGGKPLPTMRIGQIAGRGVALARRLRAEGAERGGVDAPELIEVYPAATLRRLGFGSPPSDKAGKKAQQEFRDGVCDRLAAKVAGLGLASSSRTERHAFDALIAAYTGWLAPSGLEQPESDFNAATGWIWVPAPLALA